MNILPSLSDNIIIQFHYSKIHEPLYRKPSLPIRKQLHRGLVLCFRYTDSAVSLFLKFKFQVSLTVHTGLCRAWSEFELLVLCPTVFAFALQAKINVCLFCIPIKLKTK